MRSIMYKRLVSTKVLDVIIKILAQSRFFTTVDRVFLYVKHASLIIAYRAICYAANKKCRNRCLKKRADRWCVICPSDNAMLIEWCIGVHRPHKSSLIWQSHSIAVLPNLFSSSFFFSFSLSLFTKRSFGSSTLRFVPAPGRSEGRTRARKTRALSDDRW